MSRLSILVFSALLSLTWGSSFLEPGTQYVYKYTGRSVNGIYYMKQQNAIIELHSRIYVQSLDENTIVVKLTEGRVRRNGNFQDNPFFSNGDEKDFQINPANPDEIEGEEDQIVNSEYLGTPFVITHNKGSFTSIRIGSNEPLWVVNYKKSIASQLQIDITSIRPDGIPVDWKSTSDDNRSASFNVFEDAVTGDCSTTISVNRVPMSQVYSYEAYDRDSFEAVCQDKPVYEIVKTKDFNRCQNNPVTFSAQPASYNCDFASANCRNFLQRNSMFKYVACGDFDKLTIVYVESVSDVLVKPFAIETDELVSSSLTNWNLESKEAISARFSPPANPTEYKTLSFVFPEFEDDDQDDSTSNQPGLKDAYLNSSVPISTLQSEIFKTLRSVAEDLKNNPDSKQDNLERLAVIGRVFPMFSFDDLYSFWQQVKNEEPIIVTLFVDCVVQSGSNPAVMLIKELIEKQEISETKAVWAVAAFGYHAKSPTSELLRELVAFFKSSQVQSSQQLRQTTMLTLADLFYAACGDFISQQRFAPQLGDLCDKQDSVVLKEFLPLLVQELKNSKSPADRIVALTAFGSFGFEEILPILLPYIRGSGDFNDTAERTRAVLSLHRLIYSIPEKVHPLLTTLAGNVAERPEVRMAALGLLFSTNAPVALWQKFATSTWIEPSRQMATYTYHLFRSLANLPVTSQYAQELVEKANVAWNMVKPAPYGVPYSIYDIRSSYLEQGLAVSMMTDSYRVADEHWPVVLANRYFYQFGPVVSQPLTIFLWNYNMGEVWQNIFGVVYGKSSETMMGRARQNNVMSGEIKNIWEELNTVSRPADKRAGLLHVNLMGSINRFFNVENLEEMIPNFMAEAMKYQDKPYEVSFTKYRMLAEYNIRFPTELGLPLRFLATLPIMVSFQGQIMGDGKMGIKSDVSAELSWKLSSELRVELPFNGNYVATGVDVRVEARVPKDMRYNIENGLAKITWTPSNKITDLLYYHVKPYTISRNVADSFRPTLEDEKAVNIIDVNEQPIQRSYPLGQHFGLDLQFVSYSDLDFSDFASLKQWFKKWDVSSFSNLGFVPLNIRHRQFVLRYKPEGTKARSIQTFFQHQYATKSCQHTIVFGSGSSQSKSPSSPEIISYSPIAPEFRPATERLFKDIESGNVHLIRAGFTAEQKDGTFAHFNATFGLAKNAWYTKDFTDLQIQRYTTTGPSINANKKVDYSLCYWAARNWNSVPTHGFSKDVLYLTDDETIGFGENCDQAKIRFKAKVYRDEYAAKQALNSPWGRQCQKDMAQGFPYGSPACQQARWLDQTYNNYELSAETENLPQPMIHWTNSFYSYLNQILHPFIVERRLTESSNAPKSRASWVIKRDPYTGASNMTFVRPHETVVAQNVRIIEDYVPFSPLALAYSKVFYPLHAGRHFINRAANLTSGGVSDAKCYVGSKSVYTYDGAFYNYTVDQCDHVLMTDCSKQTELAVLARQQGEYKVVQVIYGKDRIELHPAGYVSINGAKTELKSIDKESRFEIRSNDNKRIMVVVYPLPTGAILEIRDLYFFVKVQGSHVQLSAPHYLRGRTCGMCGDFNQETYGEFKSPQRCALSEGELMATSFKMSSGEQCSSKKNDEISKRLQKETESCQSADQYFYSYLPDVDMTTPTKCTRFEKLNYEGTFVKASCESVEYAAQCQPGCKPHMYISRPFTFKCNGGSIKDFTKSMTVPNACVSA